MWKVSATILVNGIHALSIPLTFYGHNRLPSMECNVVNVGAQFCFLLLLNVYIVSHSLCKKKWNENTAWVDMNYFWEIFMLLSEIRWNHILNWYVCVFTMLPFLSFFLFSTVPVVAMEALIGETVYLPCNVSTHDVNDDVVLVLWYRADKGTPIYR